MADTIWDRIKSAVHWLWGDGSGANDRAGVRVVPSAPPVQAPHTLVNASAVATSAPALASAGINIAGIKTINLCGEFGAAGASGELRVWLYANGAWYPPENVKSIAAPSGQTRVYLEPFDAEGWERLHVQFPSAPTAALTVRAFPFNVES